ncbi:uncharacterized protein PHALS_14771 [Plasmopara halstedii]|uniref:Uncharacterized protein n=1 Tax=Plasmopara halstedii TaxID=4781 RepID=A0A0N7L6E7_PLAHL|nr:uncharacterized protein PHALS_14771 [Plasmopara halstedii]CEG44067.1 hypothetical protein PHALS_14771 [Plasmopara halstedii]|eukprot:XP_024580436.1 hypothetical protein PHALS_14771 [Plasmopara halstedii]
MHFCFNAKQAMQPGVKTFEILAHSSNGSYDYLITRIQHFLNYLRIFFGIIDNAAVTGQTVASALASVKNIQTPTYQSRSFTALRM